MSVDLTVFRENFKTVFRISSSSYDNLTINQIFFYTLFAKSVLRVSTRHLLVRLHADARAFPQLNALCVAVCCSELHNALLVFTSRRRPCLSTQILKSLLAAKYTVCCSVLQCVAGYRLIWKVGWTNSYGRNFHQNCSKMNFNLNWDCSVIDLMVPVEKTKSPWSSQTLQLLRKFGNQIQSIVVCRRTVCS